jgi:hypothetical protein
VSRNIGFAVSARAFWLVIVVAVAGCASNPLASRSIQEIVKEKAQAKWDAMVKSDFARAYEFMSPAGKSVTTAAAYANSLKPGFWVGAKVYEVTCPSAELCDVEMLIDYTYAGRKMSTTLREKWVKQDSDWWYLYER